MAGTNQAVNLGGMMNQIAGTIGSGYTINGKNAGAAIGDTLANLARPDVDNGTAEEYERLAEWASKNGRDVEYAQASQQAARAQKEQRTMEAMASVSVAGDLAGRSAKQGDMAGIAKQEQDVRAKMAQYQKENNFEGFQAAQQELRRIDQMVPQAQEVETDNKAAGITNFRKILNDGGYYGKDKEGNDTFIPLDKNGKQKAQIEQQMRALEQDDGAVRKASDRMIRDVQTREAQGREETNKTVDGLQTQINSAKSDEDLDALLASIENSAVKAAVIPYVDVQRNQIARQAEREANRLVLESPVVSSSDYERMSGMVNEIGMGDANDEVSVRTRQMLEGYAALDDMNKSNGVYHDVGARQRTEKAAQKVEEFITKAWIERMEGKRRQEADRESDIDTTMLQLQTNTLLAPDETDIGRVMTANDVDRGTAIGILRKKATKDFFEFRKEHDLNSLKAEKRAEVTGDNLRDIIMDGAPIDKLITKLTGKEYGYTKEEAEQYVQVAVVAAELKQAELDAAKTPFNPRQAMSDMFAGAGGLALDVVGDYWHNYTTPYRKMMDPAAEGPR